MRRTSIIVVSALAALPLMGSAAIAQPADGKTTGSVEWGVHSIQYNAFDYGEDGDRGTATYTNQASDFTYTADVTDVYVDAEEGVACFQYVIPEGARNEGAILTYRVVDSGTPSDAADEIGYTFTRDPERAPNLDAGCPNIGTTQTTSGNLVVH